MDAEPPFLAENELEFVVGTGKGTSMNCPLIPRGSSRGYKAYSTRNALGLERGAWVRLPPSPPNGEARTETSLPPVFEEAEMAPVTKEQALKSALASSAMEGFPVTPEVTRNCQRLLNGEVNVDSLVKEILSKRQKG